MHTELKEQRGAVAVIVASSPFPSRGDFPAQGDGKEWRSRAEEYGLWLPGRYIPPRYAWDNDASWLRRQVRFLAIYRETLRETELAWLEAEVKGLDVPGFYAGRARESQAVRERLASPAEGTWDWYILRGKVPPWCESGMFGEGW